MKMLFRAVYSAPVLNFMKMKFGRHSVFGYIGSRAMSDEMSKIREEFTSYKGGCVKLKLNDETGIAEVCISNPEKKNALSGSMMIELAQVVSELDQWTQGKGVILHSLGDVFCSGGDLDFVQNIMSTHQGYKMATLMHGTLQRFLGLPLISVALVQGQAIGGGAELALAADFRLATPSCSFMFPQKSLGVATGFGGGTHLVKLLGRAKALEILASCRKIPSEEALSLGLVSAILKPNSDCLSQANDWLSSLTRGAPQVVRTMKRIVHSASVNSLAHSLEEEKLLFASLWGGHVQKKAMQKILKST